MGKDQDVCVEEKEGSEMMSFTVVAFSRHSVALLHSKYMIDMLRSCNEQP